MQNKFGVAVLAAGMAFFPGSVAGLAPGPAIPIASSNGSTIVMSPVRFTEALLWPLLLDLSSADAPQAKTPQETTQTGASPTDTGKKEEKKEGEKPRNEQSKTEYCDSGEWIKHERGEITVGCPKVWRSDRVFSVLDGLLRDVDSITLKALQGLDPNDPNVAEIVSVVNDLQASVKFDQAGLVNNRLKLQQLKSAQQSNDLLIKRKQELIQQDLDLRKKELDMVAAGKGDPDKNPDFKTLQDTETAVKGQISDIDAQINANSGQSVSSTAATDSGSPKTGTALSALPDDLKKTIQGLLRQPTFPATIRMDNVIELLHQRLAREFGVMYDDLSRMSEDYDLYLVQFDIGVVPYHGAKDRQAMVKLNFTERNVLAYELYPGASSYNIMRGQDKTNRVGISGAAQTLFGLGVAASFNHERNELHSGLSQSLFVAGFGAGSHQFGWLIGPAPYENFVNPGNRIVNALVLVPKTPNEANQKVQQGSVTIKVTACWTAREQRYQWPWKSHSQDCSNQDADEKEVAITVALPRATTLTVQHIAYTPKELKETPGSDLNYDQQAKAAEPPKPEAGTGTQQAKANQQPKDSQETNTVLIQFKGTIDPNLTITAGNKIINRVRDVRGRAMFGGTDETLTGNADERAAISGSRFGLLEKDSLGPDTWLEVNAHSVLLNISKNTAGTDVFPVITLAEPGSSAGELSALMAENATIRVGEFTFGLENVPEKKLPESAYQPLFTERFGPGRIKVYVDSVDNAHPSSIRVISETPREGRSSRIWLHEQAQVVLVPEDTNPNSKVWPLKCYGDQGTLSCKIPVEQINNEYPTAFPPRFKVWVDEPPYFGRPGLWADDDLTRTETPTNNQPQTHWAPQPYSSGEWSDVRELSSPGSNGIADHWEARIKLWHVPSTGSSVPELRNSGQQLKTLIAAVPKDFEKSHLTGANLRMAQHQREGWRQAAQHAADQPEVITAKFTGDWLTLCIPFPAMPLLAQRLHVESTATTVAQPPNSSAANPANRPLVPCPAEPSGTSLANSAPASSQTVELFVLPDLLPKVLPGPVKVTDLGNGGYRLEGEHLRAVQQVRLESPGPAILLDVSVGLNNVDFYATDLKPNMNYNVFVVIGNMTVPVIQEGDDKKLHQVRLLIPAPK